MTVTNPAVRRAAAASFAATGLLHLLIVREYLEEAPYVGVLFLVAAAAALYVTPTLWQRESRPAWVVAAAVSAGMFVGFVLSRTGLDAGRPRSGA